MKKDTGPQFSPIPYRAIIDGNLDPLSLRVLGIVAYRDRFGANGRGCCLSQKQIALDVGAHEKSVARSMSLLIRLGYVRAEKTRADRRASEYFVQYDEAEQVTSAVTDPQNKVTAAVTYSGEIGNNDFGNVVLNQGLPEHNISCETLDNRSCEAKDNSEGSAHSLRKSAQFHQSELWNRAFEEFPLQAPEFVADGENGLRRMVESQRSAQKAGVLNSAQILLLVEIEHFLSLQVSQEETDRTGLALVNAEGAAEFVAKVDRLRKAGRRFSPQIADQIYSRLELIGADHGRGDGLPEWAHRLSLEEFSTEELHGFDEKAVVNG